MGATFTTHFNLLQLKVQSNVLGWGDCPSSSRTNKQVNEMKNQERKVGVSGKIMRHPVGMRSGSGEVLK